MKGSQKAQKQHFRTPNYKTVRRKDTLGISLRVEGSGSRNGVWRWSEYSSILNFPITKNKSFEIVIFPESWTFFLV